MSNHLALLWDTYRTRLLPRDAPTVQLVECRRAFYVGARSLMDLVLHRLSPGDEPTDADLQLLGEVLAELNQFFTDVVAGRK